MSVLAFKALSYGADKIPDQFFEKIPGGFFTPEEKKKSKNSKTRAKSEQRTDRHRSQRERTPPTDYSDYSGYDDTDYEKEYREKQRRKRRTQSLGRSPNRDSSRSRGRYRERSSNLDGEYEMDRAERGPEFPPPPSEFKPYNPADYAPPAEGQEYYDRRESPAANAYGYPPQVNTFSRLRSQTTGSVPLFTPVAPMPQALTSRSPTGLSNYSLPSSSPSVDAPKCLSPLQITYSPSPEPPLATLLHWSTTNPFQPSGHRPSTAQTRYTPQPGYSPSPVPNQGYPYNPADYASPPPASYASGSYRAPGNAYPSPPPFYRQQSRSQPSLAQYPYPDNQVGPYLEDQPGRHESTSSSRHRHHHHDGDGKHRRAKSASHRGRSVSRVADKVRDRFEDFDVKDKNLAASVGGALAGGIAGRALGHGTLSTLVGAAIGGFGGRELEKKREK
jgi:hypothetical protein